MATGMARGAQARGKRIAFGNGQQILWDKNSWPVFQGNPNVAPPGSERDQDIEWVRFHKGHRIYNRHDRAKNRWIWNRDFRPIPGEMVFSPLEQRNGRRFGAGFVVIEPNVEFWKTSAVNKDWGLENYQRLADQLRGDGVRVAQFRHQEGERRLEGVEKIKTISFRDALAILSHAELYVGPEGGLHHGAAAVGKKAVVLFGGFIPPAVTGYEGHVNLTGGAEACGSLTPCAHCQAAMKAIAVDEVRSAALELL